MVVVIGNASDGLIARCQDLESGSAGTASSRGYLRCGRLVVRPGPTV